MIKIIDEKLLKETSAKAIQSPRGRMNFNLHQLPDPVQRMLNAIEPGSYVRPHRHIDPDKTELFVILKGKGVIITFHDDGNISDVVSVEEGGEKIGVEIPPGTWHSVISLKKGTVFLEIKDGPYVASRDKDFAPWAPEPGTEGEETYFDNLLSKIKKR